MRKARDRSGPGGDELAGESKERSIELPRAPLVKISSSVGPFLITSDSNRLHYAI